MTIFILRRFVAARFWRTFCFVVVRSDRGSRLRTNNMQFKPKGFVWKH